MLDYIFRFYGPGGIYPIDPPITTAEVKVAILVRRRHTKEFHWGNGDSIDRELVRDVIKARRGQTDLEYPCVLTWIGKKSEAIEMLAEIDAAEPVSDWTPETVQTAVQLSQGITEVDGPPVSKGGAQ